MFSRRVAASTPQDRALGSATPAVSADDPLVKLAAQGDLDAFDCLVAKHQERIFNVCLWILQDREEAADATQDAFIRAFRFLPKFRGDSSFGTWLSRIAVNVARDAVVRKGKAPRNFSTFEDEEGESIFDPPSEAPQPGEHMLREERKQRVQAALAALPEHHRVVLVLFDLQGHAYEEVSEILKLPLGTVKSRLNRARAALRQGLEEYRELFETD